MLVFGRVSPEESIIDMNPTTRLTTHLALTSLKEEEVKNIQVYGADLNPKYLREKPGGKKKGRTNDTPRRFGWSGVYYLQKGL